MTYKRSFEEAAVDWVGRPALTSYNLINIELYRLSILLENDALKNGDVYTGEDGVKNAVLDSVFSHDL